jgi:hypothetical protein
MPSSGLWRSYYQVDAFQAAVQPDKQEFRDSAAIDAHPNPSQQQGNTRFGS